MNLDLKTDGQPISYKPEYHPSTLQSNVFPTSNGGNSGGGVSYQKGYGK